MACTITISSVVVNGGNVIVTGDFFAPSHCQGTLTILVKVSCTDTNGNQISCGANGSLITNAVWSASVPCDCICGTNNVTITASASCNNPAFTCSTTTPFTLSNLCCCPSATTAFALGLCSGNTQLVNFTTVVFIPDACTFTFRRNFGDGTYGSNQTFSGPGTIYSYPVEPHNYAAPGNFTSDLEVLSPPYGCGTIDSVSVSVACAGCYSSANLAALCRFLEWLVLLSLTLALGIGFSSPCVSLGAAAIWFGTGLLALFVYLILQCQKCICDFFLKTWGRVFIAVAFVNIMFTWPGCAAVTLWAAISNALIFFTLGFAVLSVWYIFNKQICPLIMCDYWCAIAGMANITSATGIAIIAIILMNILSGFVLSIGMGIALSAVIAFASMVAIGPLHNSPCNTNTPTCQ